MMSKATFSLKTSPLVLCLGPKGDVFTKVDSGVGPKGDVFTKNVTLVDRGAGPKGDVLTESVTLWIEGLAPKATFSLRTSPLRF